MGCCTSSLVEQDSPTTPVVVVPLPEAYYSNSKPFKRLGLMWTSNHPITKSQLEKQRLDFWETAPNDGGRLEIWQALQVAFSESDIILARSILEAANIILPTGNPCEGCFDELGYNYEIPIYCLVPPVNLIYENDDDDTNASSIMAYSYTELLAEKSSNTTKNYPVPAPDSSKNPFTITVRLSIEKDLRIEIHAEQETVGSLKTRLLLYNIPNINEKSIIRMVYLGRILKDNLGFICDYGDIDLESTFTKKGYVQITNQSIIQALIFETK